MPKDAQNHTQIIKPIAEKLARELQSEGVILNWEAEETTLPDSSPYSDISPQDLARKIDHTLLKPESTEADVDRMCEEAREWSFASVCVNGTHTAQTAKKLKGSQSKAITVVGFPLGAMLPEAKAFEAKLALEQGAQEIDMVMNIGALKSKNYALVLRDMQAVQHECGPRKLKVILETGSLNQEEKIEACLLAKTARVAFVKTSTGFGKGGATVEDIQLMREVVGNEMQVKASGGIRTREDAVAMLNAGADRLGCSASVAIVKGNTGGEGY